MFRLGTRSVLGAVGCNVRTCASLLHQPEKEISAPFVIALHNRRFTDLLGLSLEIDRSYVFTFENCIFSEAALGDLESVIMEYDVLELNLSRGQFPLAVLARFLETMCVSNLKQIDLSGVVLDQKYLAILERGLSHAAFSQIRIKVGAECDVVALEGACRKAGISLTVLRTLPQRVEPKQLRKKIELVYVGKWDLDAQGGFNDYKHVVDRESLIRLITVLLRGFHFTLLTEKNEEEKTIIDSVVFTLASGKGFIVPFSRGLEDVPADAIQLVLKSLFENRGVKKSCRSCSHCYTLLRQHGITLTQVTFDLSLAVQEWNPLTNIERMARFRRRLLSVQAREQVNLVDTALSRKQWEYKFAIEHADIDYRMVLQVRRLLARTGSLAHFKTISLPLEEILCGITARGVLVNQSFIAGQLAQAEADLAWAKKAQERLIGTGLDGDILAQGVRRMLRSVRMLSENYEAIDVVVHRIYVRYVQCNPTIRIKSKPNLESLFVENHLSQFFLPEGNRKLFSIHLSSLALRVLAQLSQDPTLIKLCARKLNAEDLIVDINRVLFKKKCFLDKTRLICLYATAVLSRAEFEAACAGEAGESLERFQQVFPQVVAFHHQMESTLRGVRSEFGLKNLVAERGLAIDRLRLKILGTARDYISLFTIKLHEELARLELKTTIHSVRRSYVLINLAPNEESQVSDIAQRISGSLVKWAVPIPVQMTEIVPKPADGKPLRDETTVWMDPASMSAFFSNIPPHLAPMKTVEKTPSPSLDKSLGGQGSVFAKKMQLFSRWMDGLTTHFTTKRVSLLRGFNRLLWGQPVVQAELPESPEQEIEEALRAHFSALQLRTLQRHVVSHILRRQDTVAVLPTGYGKSICFQLPAMMLSGVTVVVSPLISLIENQLSELSQRKIPAAWIQASNKTRILNNLGEYKILYITPEALANRDTMWALQRGGVSFFAVDEAHCIHQWGKTFRSSYRDLNCIRDFFPNVPILALSATATPGVIEDIRSVLRLQGSKLVVGSFFKKNLSIHIKQRRDVETQLLAFLDEHVGKSGIVYCRTTSDVDKVHQFLVDRGYSASPYYAKMDCVSKSEVLQSFLSDKCKIVVATVAFGLGINKSNVRFICHLKMPDNIEKFYQEIGRAGRDGLPAECLMLFGDSDFVQNKKLNQQVIDSSREEMDIKTGQMYFFSKHIQCRQLSIARYFGDLETTEPCHRCDVCLGSAEGVDGTEILQQIIRSIISCHESCSVDYLVRLLCRINPYSLNREHRDLPTLGCLSAYDPLSVRGLINYSLACGYIAAREGGSSGSELLMCSELSWEILQDKKHIQIQRLRDRPVERPRLPSFTRHQRTPIDTNYHK